MHKIDGFSYYEGDAFKALELPYKGDDLSMLVLLPHEDNTDLIDGNLASCYEEARNGLQYEEKVNVSLPKFKFETEYKLGETFKNMGFTKTK